MAASPFEGFPRVPVDAPLDEHLQRIRGYLHHLGLDAFPPGPSALRTKLADAMERHLDEAVGTWVATVTRALSIEGSPGPIGNDMVAATRRWIAHVREPANVETYEVLQRHARLGFIANHPPARFLSSQLLLRKIFATLLRRDAPSDPDLPDMLALLEQELWERTLHITDFFVEGREKDLADAAESYRRSVDAAPTPMFICDASSGQVLELNRAAAREVGPRPGDTPFWELLPEEERERVRGLFSEALERGTARRDGLHLLRPAADPMPVDVRAALIEVREQATLHIVCYDLSEHHLLVQAEKMAGIGQLAAGIAHEIRNPLGIISNALYDLGELLPDASPEVKEDLQIARAEMARVQDIIGNLLEFSRDARVEKQAIDLDDLVAKTLKLMDKYLQNNGVRVQVDLAAGAACVANENGLRQVLLNLVTNAAQAMPEGGALRIETRPVEPSWIRLVLEDTGQGIPTDRLPRIFEPFFTTKDPGQGTGLGLSVVHSIVKRARGRIEVASRPGRGTRFTIHLPRAEEAAAGDGERGSA